MAIDQIHDLQQVYRKLLHSMSRPGTISSIEQETEHMDVDFGCAHALIVAQWCCWMRKSLFMSCRKTGGT